jgi:excisionase family DNA binding protein
MSRRPPPHPPAILTLGDAAALLGVSRHIARRLISAGVLRQLPVRGRKRLLRRADVERVAAGKTAN